MSLSYFNILSWPNILWDELYIWRFPVIALLPVIATKNWFVCLTFEDFGLFRAWLLLLCSVVCCVVYSGHFYGAESPVFFSLVFYRGVLCVFVLFCG